MSAANGETLVSAINRLLLRLDVRGVSANEIVACIKPLIADSEAAAINAALPDSGDDSLYNVRRLRAEVERLKADGAASAFINMSCRASRAETDRNNLRADLDAIKAILNEEKGRAERAEMELKVSRDIVSKIWTQLGSPTYEQLKGRSIYDLIDELKAELAAEREKVRVLREACERIEEQWDKNHSANPFHAGNVMQSHAMRALAATEEAQ